MEPRYLMEYYRIYYAGLSNIERDNKCFWIAYSVISISGWGMDLIELEYSHAEKVDKYNKQIKNGFGSQII